ncbi:MAG TPA: transposase [Coleofasciculaceae cyanobacterium]
MPYDPTENHRRSIRLKGYDYSNSGAYFVTICVQNRTCLFGEITKGLMQLNDAGQMVEKAWLQLPQRFPLIVTDEFVVMPNHFHGIIIITDTVGAPFVGALAMDDSVGMGDRAGTKPAPTRENLVLGDIVGAFKSITTHQYTIGVYQQNWVPFFKRLWQRNYYENIVRHETALQTFRQYIRNNPRSWESDKLHSNTPSKG